MDNNKTTLESQISFIRGSLQELPTKLDALDARVRNFKEEQAAKNSTASIEIKANKDAMKELKNNVGSLRKDFLAREKGCSVIASDTSHKLENMEEKIIRVNKQIEALQNRLNNRYAWIKSAIISAITAAAVVFAQMYAASFFK